MAKDVRATSVSLEDKPACNSKVDTFNRSLEATPQDVDRVVIVLVNFFNCAMLSPVTWEILINCLSKLIAVPIASLRVLVNKPTARVAIEKAAKRRMDMAKALPILSAALVA